MDRSIDDLLVGRLLVGRYRVEAVIGRGGMSVVYRAIDERLGRAVAVKVISFPGGEPEERAELRERLRREAAAAARIPPHPNVVQVYDHGTDPEIGVDFIAMELLPGRDLKSVLREGPLPLPRALALLEAAARGVAAGHRVGIVHRDLKPSNIVIADDGGAGTLKILDFGIAKALEAVGDEELTRTGHAPHSPAYASPEQTHRGAPVTAASDVYQLGLVGYELLAGERPYGPEEQERVRRGEDLGVPERGRWSEVPAPVREVVERALASHPDARPRDADALAEALAAAEDDRTLLMGGRAAPAAPAAAPDASPAAAPGPWLGSADGGPGIPRRGVLVTGAAAALLLLWITTRGADEPAPVPVAEAELPAAEALAEELRDLQLAAYENLRESASLVGGEEAAEAVDEVVQELMASWAAGDLETHLEHYADRVRFDGRNVSRGTVSRAREEVVDRYPDREITVDRTAINFPEPGQAVVLLDRSWDFRGDDRRWTGAARQELTLELRDGVWLVTGDRDVETYEESRDD